jgi:hypothetical protein
MMGRPDSSFFQVAKNILVYVTGLSRDSLHIYVGLCIFLGVALIWRLSLASSKPWWCALLAAAGGELLDCRDDLRQLGYWRVHDSLHDLINTMFWPSVLLLLARRTSLLGRHQETPDAKTSSKP